jgi:D-serine deaminase-like pyridoxal phosphate-dependent protein
VSLSLPQLRLDVDALDHNIRTMAAWCDEHDVALAPHVKTTMSEPVVARQVAAGAVGVTVATVDQAGIALGWGHDVLIANEVVDASGLARLRRLVERHPEREVRCLVDSESGVAAARAAFAGAGADAALEVMVDVGTAGGRTGVRTRDEARQVARLVGQAPELRLVGVAGYEGVVPNERTTAVLDAVDAHCAAVRDVFLDLAEAFETDRPVFTMGGSAFPDRVVEHLPDERDVPGTLRLLRSGCYVTHDHGTYARVTPFPDLRAALTVRAAVVSAPEPGTVVVGAGKRDLPYDVEPPVVVAVHDADGRARVPAGRVRSMYDQHTVLTGADGLAVADVVTFGISHPCSAFDRWAAYVVTDGSGRQVDVWTTRFDRPSIV